MFEMSQARFRYWVHVVLVILLTCLSGGTQAQVARMGIIPVVPETVTDQEFLVGREDGTPVTVAGELRLPRSGNERFPLVILLHGSGGIGGFVTDWEQQFLAMGVATFVIDSFTGPGIVSTINDQSQAGRLVPIEDAYRALALLERHPRIDSSRVMLMGLSRGGQSALYASMTRFQRMHAAGSVAHFAAQLLSGTIQQTAGCCHRCSDTCAPVDTPSDVNARAPIPLTRSRPIDSSDAPPSREQASGMPLRRRHSPGCFKTPFNFSNNRAAHVTSHRCLARLSR
jgi:poly(3-hydroxybutyrate) depolymerase